MAQDWVNTVSSIGTASGRDFTDPTSWDASFPSDFRTGGGVNHVGLMFADSDFTDVALELGPATTSNVTRVCSVKLVNALGEKPIWKPGTGGSVNSYVNVRRGMLVAGIIFDGTDRDVATGLVALRGEGSPTGQPVAIGCTFKNSSRTGLRFATTSSATGLAKYCLAFDNVHNGFSSTSGPSQFAGTLIHCGSAFNGSWGYGADFSNNTWELRGSWARGNTTGAVQILKVGGGSVGANTHNVIDDGSFTTLGLMLGGTDGVDILESATQANFAFVNEAGRDFTPGAGSVLLGKGPEFASQNAPREAFDVNGNRLAFNWEDRMDVGPIQSKFSVAAQLITPLTVVTGFALDPTTGVEVISP